MDLLELELHTVVSHQAGTVNGIRAVLQQQQVLSATEAPLQPTSISHFIHYNRLLSLKGNEIWNVTSKDTFQLLLNSEGMKY